MQIRNKLILSKGESKFDEGLIQELSKYMYDLASLLNGGIRLDENCHAQIVSVSDTGLADTEFEVAHTLRRIPTGFIIVNRDAACIVYDSGTTWTATTIYLKCNTANANIKVLAF